MRHRFGSVLFAVAAAIASTAVSAHAVLIDSSPKPKGHLAAGPQRLVFKYNSKIDQGRSRLSLVKPDGSASVLTIASDSQPNELDSQVTLTPGSYKVHWQALALDGHLTRGDVPFTVDAKP